MLEIILKISLDGRKGKACHLPIQQGTYEIIIGHFVFLKNTPCFYLLEDHLLSQPSTLSCVTRPFLNICSPLSTYFQGFYFSTSPLKLEQFGCFTSAVSYFQCFCPADLIEHPLAPDIHCLLEHSGINRNKCNVPTRCIYTYIHTYIA